MLTESRYTETQELSPTATEYRIVGGFDAVIGRVRTILRKYHPVGYGTTVKIEHQYPSGDTWTATVKRSNSCE